MKIDKVKFGDLNLWGYVAFYDNKFDDDGELLSVVLPCNVSGKPLHAIYADGSYVLWYGELRRNVIEPYFFGVKFASSYYDAGIKMLRSIDVLRNDLTISVDFKNKKHEFAGR